MQLLHALESIDELGQLSIKNVLNCSYSKLLVKGTNNCYYPEPLVLSTPSDSRRFSDDNASLLLALCRVNVSQSRILQKIERK